MRLEYIKFNHDHKIKNPVELTFEQIEEYASVHNGGVLCITLKIDRKGEVNFDHHEIKTLIDFLNRALERCQE